MAEFNDLPNEIKLHVFSFLSARDLARVNRVDREHHALVNKEARLWRARARQDFARELDDASANEAGYAALNEKMHAELNKECGMILALRWIHQKLGADRQQNMLEFYIHHDLPVLNRLDKDDLLRAFEFRTRDQFFAAFVECRDRHITQGDCTDVSEEDMQCVWNVVSPETSYEDILSFYPEFTSEEVIEVIMATLVRARAVTALEFFLRKIPASVLSAMHPLLARAYVGALYYADVEMVKVLLRAGMNANAVINCNGVQRTLLHNWSRLLDSFIWRTDTLGVFIEENEQEINGLADDMQVFCSMQLDNYAAIANILLTHGADPDLVQVDNPISPREAVTAVFHQNQMAGVFMNVSFADYDRVARVVMDAPELVVAPEAEPVFKRPRP